MIQLTDSEHKSLLADKARLDWLEKQGKEIRIRLQNSSAYYFTWNVTYVTDNLREAIDRNTNAKG